LRILPKAIRLAGLLIGLIIISITLKNFAMAQQPAVFSETASLTAGSQAADREHGQVIMVLIDRITLDDFLNADIPVLKKTAMNGVLGLMTTNPAAGFPRVPENTYTTIGAGAKVQGGSSAVLAFNSFEEYENDTAADAYYRRTGLEAGKSEVLHLGVAEMERANLGLKYEFVLGAIGEALHQKGFKTAVIGNADIPGALPADKKNFRQAAVIAMDSRGQVDFGDVSARTYKYDPEKLPGIKTDYSAMLSEFLRIRDKADLVVLETGDTARIDKMSYVTSNEVLRDSRIKSLAEIDGFLGKLLENVDLNRDLALIVVPQPPTDAMETGNFLTPFVMAGGGVVKGVAWSGTTKRHGLITNIDIAPTILRYFGLPPAVKKGGELKDVLLSGQVIENRESVNPVESVKTLNRDAVFIYNARYPFVKGYINGALAIVVLGLLATALDIPVNRCLKPALVAMTVVPGVLLWANYLPHPSMAVLAMETAALVVFFTLMFMYLGKTKPLNPFIYSSGLTVFIIACDLLLGAPLAKTSPLSYDAMAGARFYGIGNEFMGVLIGSCIAFVGLASDLLKNWSYSAKALAVLLFVAVTYVIAAPGLGSNVGGTIAAVAGFGVSSLLLFGREINRKTVLALSAMILVVTAGFIVYDLSRAVEVQSHIGRTIASIREYGFSEVFGIISRKWAVNFKLIKKTTWSWFYFISLLSILYLGRMLPKRAQGLRQNSPVFDKLLTGMIFGSAFALVFNDSGVVAAATLIIYGIAPFLTWYIPVQRRTRK